MRRIAGFISVLAVLGLVSPASAAFPGSVGRIAFDDGSNIFTAQPNGARLLQLTSDGDSHDPRWSPDGRRIAFDRGGFIYVMSATGGNVHRATPLGHSYQPAWSANGKRLAFVHIPVGKPGDIWTVPLSGGSASRVTFDASSTCGDSHPVWSPAGGLIAFDQQPGTWLGGGACQSGEFRRVVVFHLADRTRYGIDQAWDPDFTADGNGLFFTSRLEPEGFPGADNLYASDLTGQVRTKMTFDGCEEGDACFVDGTAAPTSGFPAALKAIWEESHVDGSACLISNAGNGTRFCYQPDQYPFVQHIDWQARPMR